MKLFLTGQVQIGKSTLINRFINYVEPHCSIGGFRTITVGDIPGAVGSVYIVPVQPPPPYCDVRNRVGIRYGGPVRPFEGFVDVFDVQGVKLLKQSRDCDLLVMDEIGVMESGAQCFAAALMEQIQRERHILGVLKQKPSALIERIRSQPDVCVLEVTKENRDGLLDVLIRRWEGA